MAAVLPVQPHPSRRRRQLIDEETLGSESRNPADVVAFRLDFEQWWTSLTERQQEVLGTLAQGHNTVEAARILGCTRGNVSEIRRLTAKKYAAFLVLAGESWPDQSAL